MSRDPRLFLEDILRACTNILQYVESTSRDEFMAGGMAFDAIVRNLEVIGEAVKRVPDDVRTSYPEVDWRRISGLRDILAHAYFSLDPYTLWTIVDEKVPVLVNQVRQILDSKV